MKRASRVFVPLLFVGGVLCSIFAPEIAKSLELLGSPIPYEGTEISTFYSQFYRDWEYVKDEEDGWIFSPSLRGDCEDFSITFCGLYPGAEKCWVVIVPASDGGATHAVLFLESTDGWYVVDNQSPYLSKGADFLDLYDKYEVISIVELPDPSKIAGAGDLTRHKGGESP